MCKKLTTFGIKKNKTLKLITKRCNGTDLRNDKDEVSKERRANRSWSFNSLHDRSLILQKVAER
jgi:hypothetical protein